ncbi:MAG: DUF2911 domain-containing protein [bacterium]|nr:DUF2911 domain-containing protein [bacterium]
MKRILAAVALPVLALTVAAVDWSPPPIIHPHFLKKLECRVSRELSITVRYQTVTFDKAGAAKMKPGQAWHLAGANIETTGDLVIGGKAVPAGRYALSARKVKDDGWELTMHEGRGFSLPRGEEVHVLATKLDTDSLLFEHMNIDVQPAGDKEHTRLQLEVRFDKMWATTLIEVPEKK